MSDGNWPIIGFNVEGQPWWITTLGFGNLDNNEFHPPLQPEGMTRPTIKGGLHIIRPTIRRRQTGK